MDYFSCLVDLLIKNHQTYKVSVLILSVKNFHKLIFKKFWLYFLYSSLKCILPSTKCSDKLYVLLNFIFHTVFIVWCVVCKRNKTSISVEYIGY